MLRNASHQALILKCRSLGESNREVWLLTADTGLLRATMFGGPKSRLRSHIAPFNSGEVWVYHEPVKDTYKISDFDVRSWRPGLRELYERSVAAGAVAETILASHGGGGQWGEALALAEAALDVLAGADADACARIPVHFFWRWAGFLGLAPDMDSCAVCGNGVGRGGWFSFHEGGILCAACTPAHRDCGNGSALIPAGPGCRHWLTTVRSLPPAQVIRFTLDKQSFQEARLLTTAILAEALGRHLSSWDWYSETI